MDEFLAAIIFDDAINLVATFGESVEYRPFNGTPRTIQAVIDRNSIIQAGNAGPHRPPIRMTCSTDPILGINPATIDWNNDRVYVQYIAGRPNDGNDRAFGFNLVGINATATGILEVTLT